VHAYTKSLQGFSTGLFDFRNSRERILPMLSHHLAFAASGLHLPDADLRRIRFPESVKSSCRRMNRQQRNLAARESLGCKASCLLPWPVAACIIFNRGARVKGFSSRGMPSLMFSVWSSSLLYIPTCKRL
jgi:hypothetical protein